MRVSSHIVHIANSKHKFTLQQQDHQIPSINPGLHARYPTSYTEAADMCFFNYVICAREECENHKQGVWLPMPHTNRLYQGIKLCQPFAKRLRDALQAKEIHDKLYKDDPNPPPAPVIPTPKDDCDQYKAQPAFKATRASCPMCEGEQTSDAMKKQMKDMGPFWVS